MYTHGMWGEAEALFENWEETLADLDRLLATCRVVEASGCLVWASRRKTHNGYGKLLIRRNGRPIEMRAHRFAFQVCNGRLVARGKDLAHSCDNPACCNPLHLLELTRREHNVYDRKSFLRRGGSAEERERRRVQKDTKRRERKVVRANHAARREAERASRPVSPPKLEGLPVGIYLSRPTEKSGHQTPRYTVLLKVKGKLKYFGKFEELAAALDRLAQVRAAMAATDVSEHTQSTPPAAT